MDAAPLTMETRKIRHCDTVLHAEFFRFVASIFPGTGGQNWTDWRDRGGWTDQYEVFAAIAGDRIVSTIGRSRMRLVIDGQDRIGYQLGAVATLEPYRGQGLARRLMHWVIDELDDPDQPIILFANSTVLDFYPRLGFRRIPQRRATATAWIEPSGVPPSAFDPASASDRQRLAALCARAHPIRGPLVARDYGWIALWNLICGPVAASWLPAFDALIATTIENDCLVIHDVIAPHSFDLGPVLPTLIPQPIRRLEFLFDPEDWWAAVTCSERDDTDSRLFVRGGETSMAGPVQFPALAHT
jgi:predicted N-acetyltransferase YhbS